jgi:hypothetical protein
MHDFWPDHEPGQLSSSGTRVATVASGQVPRDEGDVMSLLSVVVVLALEVFAGSWAQGLGESRRPTAPESFSANANVAGAAGAGAARLVIQVDRYSPAGERDAVAQALRERGYAAFLEALHKAAPVGTLTLSGETFSIQWAREARESNGRTIVLITDKPVYFVGGGSTKAKPRDGYDIAVLKFKVDDAGLGYDGMMAAAARVKADAAGDVEIEDYADAPIRLVTVSRTIK